MTVERFTGWLIGIAVMLIIATAFSGWAVVRVIDYSNQASRQAQRAALKASQEAQQQARAFAKAVQTSRYDGALVACENTNTRHLNALQYVDALDSQNPTAGVLATNLLNVLAPLRDGRDGRETCEQYAQAEVALRLTPRTTG